MNEHKTFQVALWKTPSSKLTDALLREYETISEAQAEYDREQVARRYEAGGLYRWLGDRWSDPISSWGLD